MEDILNRLKQNPVDPLRLTADSIFKFACHKGLECFNVCCGGLEIFLTPYDILKLKNHLGLTSGEFLERHAQAVMLKKTRLPLIKLKMAEGGRCSFVTPEGCSVYDSRPAVCRYYPLGSGAVKGTKRNEGEFYLLIKEKHCLGFNETRMWSVDEWRINQGVTVYDGENKDWIDLILNKKLNADVEPDERSLRMFYMGSYDIDLFRNFVFESRFLDTFELEDALVEEIRGNETSLMRLAHRWLKYVLFKEPVMKLKPR
jgi:hypothetical protein